MYKGLPPKTLEELQYYVFSHEDRIMERLDRIEKHLFEPVNTVKDALKFDKTEFNFSAALILLKEGRKMKRIGWSSPNMWIQILRPPHLAGVRPYFKMKTREGDFSVWFPAICDILADDWVEVAE